MASAAAPALALTPETALTASSARAFECIRDFSSNQCQNGLREAGRWRSNNAAFFSGNGWRHCRSKICILRSRSSYLPAAVEFTRWRPVLPRQRPPSASAADTVTSASTSSPTSSTAQAFRHKLPSGLSLEVLVQKAENADTVVPPLVFIHGSYHAAWCWAEQWMPFFASHGYDCYAVSLLGQGASDVPEAPVAGTIQSHAADVSHLIRHVIGRPPVLVGHSFGGLIVQAYIADVAPMPPPPPSSNPDDGWEPPFYPIAAAVLLCSVPPTGNMIMVQRFLRNRPISSIKITLSLAAKMFATSASLCRDSFFSPEMPNEDVKRYQVLLKESSKKPLFDLRKLNASLPVALPPAHLPPVFVIGAENDTIVDEEGLQETADFFSTTPEVLPGIAHDIMIDVKWKAAAETLLERLQTLRGQ